MNWPLVSLVDALASAEVFVDGDWVESKDQDPEGDVRLVQLADVGDGEYIDKSDRYLTSAKARELRCTFIEPGDILVARMPDPLGRACIFPGDARRCVTVVDVCIIRPDSQKHDPRWLMHCLNGPFCRNQIAGYATGTTRSRISRGNLGKIRIPSIPLPEQQRIAEILDKADALRTKRRAALAQLDTLAQSIFLDIFGDPASNPRGWPVRTFGELFDICSSKRVLESQWQKAGIPFYRAREIVKLAKQGYVDNDLFISEELFNDLSGESGAPKAGDLMVSAVGTLGACYQVRDGDRFYFKDASVLRFIPKAEVDPVFVRHAFGTGHVLRQVHGGSGSTVGTYTIARARQTRLYAPPFALQRRFSEIVKCVQSQSALQTTALNESEALFASLQHGAFRREM